MIFVFLITNVLLILFLDLLLFCGLKTLFINSHCQEISEVCISVIIAIKNESKSLQALIDSLSKLDYPKEKFEVIFVDDLSDDKSYEIINNSITSYENFRMIMVENKKYPGKKGALDLGITSAKYPNILITDGDCVVSRNWLNEFAVKFANGFDFTFGICPVNKGKKFVSLISSFENLRAELLSFSVANLGLPYSAAARSFGFKKESFLKISGYKNTVETLGGDDDLLLREAVKNKLKIGIVTAPDAFVYSNSESNLKDYFQQKKRHTSTSNHYLFRHKLILSLWHLTNLISLFSILLTCISVYFLTSFFVKLILDVFLVKRFMKKFGTEFNLSQIIILQVCYEIFLVTHYLNASFSKNISWKKS